MKIFLLVGLFMVGYYIYQNYWHDSSLDELQDKVNEWVEQVDTDPIPADDRTSLLPNPWPKAPKDDIVQHRFFTLSYSEKDEQARWVSYELEREKIQNRLTNRTNDFRVDPQVKSGSATLDDYRKSGYDRGHLCPAGDMAFSNLAMSESFYLSNISPQDRSFNRGIWRELEEQTRDWALANKHLYVVTGPVLRKIERNKIGENRVTVPKAFFKVLLDLTPPEYKAAAFIIPNKKQTAPLDVFAMTVDEAERRTGIDFFPALDDELEREIEANFNPYRWIYDEERFRSRVGKWNHLIGK